MVQPVILRFRGQPAGLSEGGESYQADVVAAPGRGWGGPFQSLGLAGQQAEEMRQLYRGYVSRHQKSGDLGLGQQELHLLRLLGNQLFEMLPETIQERLRQAGPSLALTLQFEPSAYPLLDLPWELLHDPAGHRFYALQGGGITRQLLPALPGREFSGPESPLGLWAAPAGLNSLESRQQFEPAPGRGQQFTWLEGANSLEKLQQALDSGLHDSLHLVAHGQVAVNFRLGLAAGDGSPQWFDTDRLATLLNHYPTLQLLYLDVCNDKEGQDEGGLVAFVRGAGLPAVILMQDTMGQVAAGRMAQSFYQALAKGVTLGEAVTAGRRAIRLQGDDPIQWSIPALYTRPSAKPATPSPLADWFLDLSLSGQLPFLWLGLALALFVGHLSRHLAMVAWDSPLAVRSSLLYLLAANLLPIIMALVTRQGQAQLQEKYQLTGRSWLPVLLQKQFGASLWSGFVWLTIWFVWVGVYMAGLAGGLAPAGKQAFWFVGLSLTGLAAHIGARQAIRQNLLFLRVGFALFRGIGSSIALLLVGFSFYLLMPLLMLGVVYLLGESLRLTAGQSQILFITLILGLATALYLGATKP